MRYNIGMKYMKNFTALILYIVILFVLTFSFVTSVHAQGAEETLKNPSPCGTPSNRVEVPLSVVLRVDPLPQATSYRWYLDGTFLSSSDEASEEIGIGTNNNHWWSVRAYKGEKLLGSSRACYIKGTIGPALPDYSSTFTPSASGTSSPIKCIPIPGKVVCIENPLNTGSLTEIIDKVINFIFRIALVVVPLMILYGGFLFVTGGGNPDQISRGKRVLMWTVIGLIVIILSKGLVTLLQTALGVSGS